MNWGAIDLNLLVVFDAVMQERSVTRAGARIGLSQPAMSHALRRLRHQLGDELFVRTPDGMRPTPRAETLGGPLRNALAELQLALEPEVFEPAASNRRFVIALNNHAAVALGPRLAAAVSVAAPGVCLDLRPSGTLDVAERLDHGDLDLAVGALDSPGERFVAEPLQDDRFVVVMRRGHPAMQGPLTEEVLAGLSYLEISSSGEDTSFVTRRLAQAGLARRIALRAPFLSAVSILAQSDLAAIFNRRVAEVFIASHPLQLGELPWETPPVRSVMLWHRRLDGHPAHRWLRGLIATTAREL